MRFLDRFLRQSPPATTEELDRIVLRQLQARGADLARPRHVLHFLYFAGERDARAAVVEIEAAGYAAALMPPASDGQPYAVRAEATRIADFTTVPAFRQQFEKIAADYAGEYDGWEASAEP